LAIPTIIVGIVWGIQVMILGIWVNSLIAYYLNSYWSGRFINYPMREQVADIMPGFLIAVFVGFLVYLIGWLIPVGHLLKLIIQIISGGLLTLVISEFFKFDAYMELRNIAFVQLIALRNARK
jgi:hypothetical protein